MSDWVRVATFDGDEAAARRLIEEIEKESGPPPEPSTCVTRVTPGSHSAKLRRSAM